MSKTVKTPGGVTVRVIEALNGFRTKHGNWPERLEIEARTLADLATYSLTPLGFFQLQSKVDLAMGTDGKLVAFGPERQTFDYAMRVGRRKACTNMLRELGLASTRAMNEPLATAESIPSHDLAQSPQHCSGPATALARSTVARRPRAPGPSR